MRERAEISYSLYVEALAERFSHGVLEELQDYEQFVAYIKTPDNKKIPINPNTHEYARTDDPSTWSTLEQSLKALRTGRYAGIGFVFSEEDPFTGIDIDNAIQGGHLTEQAQELVTQFWSYTEISPSGKGIHILVEGELPEGRRKDGKEGYSKRRFFTLTTRHLKGSPDTIEYRQRELDTFYESLAPVKPPETHFKPPSIDVFVRSDVELMEKASTAKNGDKFLSLYQGNISGFQSKSHADWQLILYLLRCTNDVDQVKRLFLQSNLVDEKTLSRRGDSTYLDFTIANALRKKYN